MMNTTRNQLQMLAVLILFLVSFGIFENSQAIVASLESNHNVANVLDAFLGISGNTNSTTNETTNENSSDGGYLSTISEFFGSLINTPATTNGTTNSISMTATGTLSGTTPILVCLPGTITSGEPVILMWACRDSATKATGDNFDTDDAVLGAIRINPTENTTYTLNCLTEGGVVENTAATCTIHIAKPVLTISATPINVPYGDTATIAWSTQETKSCTVTSSGHFGFSRTGTTGSVVSPSITKDTTFTLTCESMSGLLETNTVKVNAS